MKSMKDHFSCNYPTVITNARSAGVFESAYTQYFNVLLSSEIATTLLGARQHQETHSWTTDQCYLCHTRCESLEEKWVHNCTVTVGIDSEHKSTFIAVAMPRTGGMSSPHNRQRADVLDDVQRLRAVGWAH